MTEHYTLATESVLRWCNTCRRLTVHPVSGGRAGRCSEHERSQRETKAQIARRGAREYEEANPRLFV